MFRANITRAWPQDKPIAVAAAWGIDPLFMLVGSQTFPKNVSEYDFAGGIKGQPSYANFYMPSFVSAGAALGIVAAMDNLPFMVVVRRSDQ